MESNGFWALILFYFLIFLLRRDFLLRGSRDGKDAGEPFIPMIEAPDLDINAEGLLQIGLRFIQNHQLRLGHIADILH